MRLLCFALHGLPDVLADATRVMNFAKAFKQKGHEVDLLGVTSDKQHPLQGNYDGLEYQMLPLAPFYGFRAGKRISKLKKDIVSFLATHATYDAIILSNVYYDCADVFLKYAKQTGAKLIMNSVEWYEKDNVQFRGVRGKINFIKNRIALKKIHVQMGNIIAISSLLDDYYKARGCNTVTIPTIVDLKEYADVVGTRKGSSDVLTIAYAGAPGRKDYIINAILALELLTEEERNRIRLHFYGPKMEQLHGLGLLPAFLERYQSNIVCHGRIPYSEVKTKIAAADFTVLLRPNKRYANAGFPTKVGESMACGTPVIANITSDLGKYILDEKTGIVCADETPQACAEAFRRALALPAEQKQEMHQNCLDMAKKAFDYRVYADALDEFIKR